MGIVHLPKYSEISKDNVEVILIAKKFSQSDVDKAKKSNGSITLIRYFWFEDNLFLIDYLNNDPDDLIEMENAEKLKKIKAIIDNRPTENSSEIDMFFHKADDSKSLFKIFRQFLLERDQELRMIINKHTIRILTQKTNFSVVGFTGRAGKKSLLRIDTNVDMRDSKDLKYDDRMGENGKLKGSLSSERYQVYIFNQDDLDRLMSFLIDKVN